MVCKNCGTAIGEGSLFCENCGSPVSEETMQEQLPVEEVVEETPAEVVPEEESPVEEPVITLNSEAEPEKAKSKSKLIALIGLGAIVIAAVLILLNLSSLKAWYNRTVSSPEELMSVVYKDNVAESISEASGAFEVVKQAYSEGNQTITGELHIKIGDQILDLLETAIYGGDGDISWLSDIVVDYEMTQSDPYMEMILGLGLGEHSVISYETILNMETMQQWIKIPELNEQSLTSTYSMGVNTFENPYSEVVVNSLPSADVLSEIYSRVMDIVLDGFSAVDKKTETMTVGGVSQEVLVLEAKMSEESMMRVIIGMLENLKTDADVKAFFDNLTAECQALIEENSQILGVFVEESDLYAEFVAAVDEVIAEMNAALPYCDTENYLVLYTYLNDSNGIAGIRLDVFGSLDQPGQKICFLNLEDGDKFAFEFTADDVKITGEGTTGKTLNATYSLISADEKLLDLKIMDGKNDGTNLSGTLRIEPSAALLEQFTADMNPGVSAMLGLTDIALQIDLNSNKDAMNMTIAVLANENNLVALEYVFGHEAAKEIIVPETAIDMTADTAIYEWLMNVDVQNVLDNLTAAGIPEDLINSLIQSLMGSAFA